MMEDWRVVTPMKYIVGRIAGWRESIMSSREFMDDRPGFARRKCSPLRERRDGWVR